MNKEERTKMVKCMEYICRQINHEGIFMSWLSLGVADSDINYGDLSLNDEDDLDYYIEDENFSDLMSLFTHLIKMADEDGGLVCDGIIS